VTGLFAISDICHAKVRTRAATVRVWIQHGQPWTQGSLLTAALWVAALAAHLGYDYLLGQHKDISGIGNGTAVMYLAVSLGVQRLIVTYRAQRLDPVAAGPFGPARSRNGAS
jgi:hypothetical protein